MIALADCGTMRNLVTVAPQPAAQVTAKLQGQDLVPDLVPDLGMGSDRGMGTDKRRAGDSN